jgi:hypothetical protein
VGLGKQVQELQEELASTVKEADDAKAETERLKGLGRKFWEDEWQGLRDFVLLFVDEKRVEEVEKDIDKGIEEKKKDILKEYGKLFTDRM